jgi:hypothetical protein
MARLLPQRWIEATIDLPDRYVSTLDIHNMAGYCNTGGFPMESKNCHIQYSRRLRKMSRDRTPHPICSCRDGPVSV